MKILITGTNGYIGQSLYNAFKEKYDVESINRNNFDLTDSKKVNLFFEKGCFDIVIHCAVKGGSRLKQDSWDVMDDNLKMYYNLISNRFCFNKFIHFGSGAELYNKEEPYGYSKDIIRKSILEKNYFYNLRIFGVFDENELDTRFIKANIKRYINKEPILIYQNKIMDFFYMKDLVKLVNYYILNDNVPKEINCSYSNSFSLFDIANIINSLDDHRVQINIEKKDMSSSFYTGDYHHLGLDFIGLEKGIKEVYSKLKK